MSSLLFKTLVQIVSRGTRDGLLTMWESLYGVYYTKFCCVLADVHQMQRQLREHPSQAWYSHHESVRPRNLQFTVQLLTGNPEQKEYHFGRVDQGTS